MSEPEKSKRKFWQFHLSTAVLLMLVTAFFIYKNLEIISADPVYILG